MKSVEKKGGIVPDHPTPGVKIRTGFFSKSFAGGTRCSICGTYVEDGVCDQGHSQVATKGTK